MLGRVVLSSMILLALPASAPAAATLKGFPGDFGDVPVGARSPIIYLPVYALSGSRRVADVGEPTNGRDFTIPIDTCTGTVVTTTQPCFIGVRFSPSVVGAVTASVPLSDGTPGGGGTMHLDGTGAAPPGQNGPSAAGPAGPQGVPGPAGPPGVQGVPGRAIQATCVTRGRPPKTKCYIVVLPDDTAAVSLRARLVRNGRTVARGSAPREGRVKLKTLRRVRRGRHYTLAVSFVVDGQRVHAQHRLRLR